MSAGVAEPKLEGQLLERQMRKEAVQPGTRGPQFLADRDHRDFEIPSLSLLLLTPFKFILLNVLCSKLIGGVWAVLYLYILGFFEYLVIFDCLFLWECISKK